MDEETQGSEMSVQGRVIRERYNESMVEREANGLPHMSLSQWILLQARLDVAFHDLKEQKMRGRRDAQAFGSKSP